MCMMKNSCENKAAHTNGVPKVLADARRAAIDSAMYSETNLVIEVGGK